MRFTWYPIQGVEPLSQAHHNCNGGGRQAETARHPGFPHPSGPPGGAFRPASQSSPCGWSKHIAPAGVLRTLKGRRELFARAELSTGYLVWPPEICSPSGEEATRAAFTARQFKREGTGMADRTAESAEELNTR